MIPLCNLNMQLTEIVLLERFTLHTGQSGLVVTFWLALELKTWRNVHVLGCDEVNVTLTNISLLQPTCNMFTYVVE